MRMSLKSQSEKETLQFGKALGGLLKAGDCVALIGDLGAGKTTFVRGAAEGLDVKDASQHVGSPTFTLVNEYEGREKIYHLDWYRLDAVKGPDREQAEECFASKGISFVEWADQGPEVLPEVRLEIDFRHAEGSTRILRLKCIGDRYKGFLQAFKKKIVL